MLPPEYYMPSRENLDAAMERAARIAARQELQRLRLTDEQMSRFQDRLLGIDRRFANVMKRNAFRAKHVTWHVEIDLASHLAAPPQHPHDEPAAAPAHGEHVPSNPGQRHDVGRGISY
ncbi:hypothetical protein [Xanthomonas sp. MUS 060]|uniref:hypothetical protein n=1 Tax=Xanthomonas sp. MUS 060 TaxID=1588031 RepID=UPI0005F2CF39|nr:hypothetical protein [Xanthomonas sp. MUS 060]